MKEYCKHCFREFSSREAWFRCVRVACEGRQTDSLFARTHGTAEVTMGRAFPPPDGFMNTALGFLRGIKEAPCPACSVVTHHRICPFCHEDLSRDPVPLKVIAVIGSSHSGKTCQIVSTLETLPAELPRFGYSGLVTDESGDQWDKLGQMFLTGDVPHLTQRTQQRPFVFRLSATDASPVDIHIYDSGGEAWRSVDEIEINVQQTQKARGFIFIIDPYQLPGLRPQLDRLGLSLPSPERNAAPAAILGRLLEIFGSSDAMIQYPFAFVITKFDVWKRALPGNKDTPLHHPSEAIVATSKDTAQLSNDVIVAESASLMELLKDWDSALYGLIQGRFDHYMVFASSALGSPPVNGVAMLPIQAERISPPILWLLGEMEIMSVW